MPPGHSAHTHAHVHTHMHMHPHTVICAHSHMYLPMHVHACTPPHTFTREHAHALSFTDPGRCRHLPCWRVFQKHRCNDRSRSLNRQTGNV